MYFAYEYHFEVYTAVSVFTYSVLMIYTESKIQVLLLLRIYDMLLYRYHIDSSTCMYRVTAAAACTAGSSSVRR